MPDRDMPNLGRERLIADARKSALWEAISHMAAHEADIGKIGRRQRRDPASLWLR
jgi:hypothetical protein